MTITAIRWTVDEYHRMIATGLLANRQVELLNGLIVEMPPESPLHAYLNQTNGDKFRALLGSEALVREGKPITLINRSEPEPDIAVVKSGCYRQAHPTAADVYLIIEFAHTSLEKDTQEKRLVYAAAGILDYWVADLQNRVLWVYREPKNGDYQSEQSFTAGFISPLAFPQLSLEISALLE